MHPLDLLFEDPQSEDAQRWLSEPLVFSSTPGVLQQRKGGPCGVLAVLQAHIELRRHFEGASSPETALAGAAREILERAATTTVDCPVETLVAGAWRESGGLVAFVVSVLEARGLERVRADMDDGSAKLTGQFAHCGQELLNLLLTGRATSQLHDGTVPLADTGLELRGVMEQPRVGLLTRLEAMRYTKVGSFLKNPQFPVWVIGSESHFTVLYSPDRHCDEKSPAQFAKENAKRAFDQRDNQENGFVKSTDLPAIFTDLFLPKPSSEIIQSCEMPGADGIIIWNDFWRIIQPLLLGSNKDNAAATTTTTTNNNNNNNQEQWNCATCTFKNPASSNTHCEICQQPRPVNNASSSNKNNNNNNSNVNNNNNTEPWWACEMCTLHNEASVQVCNACGTPRTSTTTSITQQQEEGRVEEEDVGGKTIELVHVDGLEKKVNGEIIPPKRTKLTITTVDSFLAGPGTFGDGEPFEEVLQTKWVGCVFNYGPQGTKPPSITG